MTIKILNGGAGRRLNVAVMAKALMSGKVLHGNHPWAWFEVDNWGEFCSLFYRTCAELSRTSAGAALYDTMHVHVLMPSGKEYETDVWCDIENRGIRYASLY